MKTMFFVFALLLSLTATSSDTLNMSPEHREELNELFHLRAQANEQFTEVKKQMGLKAFKASVDENKQTFTSELGEVELTLIDGEIVEKVRPFQSQKIFVFVDENKVDRMSKHLLKVFIPRQHIDGGLSRTDGERGRDIVLIWMKSKNASAIEHHDRPKSGSLKWWKEYAQATYKKPKKADVMFGLFSASLQVAFAAGVSKAAVLLDPSKSFNIAPLVLNGVFGSLIGTFSTTYVNWVYRAGTKADPVWKVRAKQAAKSSVVSVLYAYSLVMATSSGVDTVNFLNLSALQTHLHVWSNIFFNNWAKVEFAQWAKILERKRADIKEIEVRLPFTGKTWKTGITQRKMNFQIYSYTPVNTLRTADLIGVSFSGIPLGKLLLWFSVPFTKYATLKWAERYHPEQAEELRLREDWQKLISSPVRLPVNAVRSLAKLPGWVKNQAQQLPERIRAHRCISAVSFPSSSPATEGNSTSSLF